MGLLELAQMDMPESELIPEGEHRVEIVGVEEKVFKSGRPGYSIRLVASDVPDSETIFHNVMSLMEGDPKKTERMMIQNAKEFQAAFNIQTDDPETWKGLEGWASIGVEEYESVVRNKVVKFLPRR